MDRDLGAVVGVSADELALNRGARLSDRQRGTLQRARTGGRRYGLLVLAVLIVFVVAIVVVLVPKLNKEQHSSGEKVPVVPIVLAVLAFVVVIFGGGIRYEVTVGTTTFFVASQRVLDASVTGSVYRAYYAAGGGHAVMNRLLSAERIG